MKPTKVLIEKLNKLKECLASTTACLAPYPTLPIDSKKNEKTKKHNSKNL